jgi:hypothetical protein
MTNSERQARFRQKRQAELERLKVQLNANAPAVDWRNGKTPEQIAELDKLARQLRAASELCNRSIDEEWQALR